MSLAGVVGIPATDHGRWSAFRACLTELVLPPGWAIKECHGASESRNRHAITAWALAQGAERLFFLDDDLLFQPDVLLRTLQRDESIVVGLSLFRRMKEGQFCPVWSTAGPGPVLWEQVTRIERGPNGLMRLGAATVGGLLAHRSVFEAIGEPYWRKHPDDPFDTSSDIDWYWRAQRAGFEVWGDPDVHYGHITHLTVWPHEEQGRWHTLLARGFEPFAALPWKDGDDERRVSRAESDQAAPVA